MARRFENLRFGVLVLAFAITLLLWFAANGRSKIQQPFDVPVVLLAMSEKLVVTEQSVDDVNISVVGSRAALRNVKASDLSYPIDVSGGKQGTAEYEVDVSRIDLPRGTRIVSRSPSRIQVRFERRGRKAVGVRPDIAGQPAGGFVLKGVEVKPRRVWLVGARSQVLRLNEVVTEPIDIDGLSESVTRDARLYLGSGTVWMENPKPVVVSIEIEQDPELVSEDEAAGGQDG